MTTQATSLDQATPTRIAAEFADELKTLKASAALNWYPHQILANVTHLEPLLPDWIRAGLLEGFQNQRVLDIGAADGDLGYLFARKGCQVDFLENPQTNYNDCQGIRKLGELLHWRGELIEHDVDRGFALKHQYDLAICLGILYHLRNPMLVLMELAAHAENLVLSTRVCTQFPDGSEIGDWSCAYFLETRESNDDPTNYWAMTPKCLRRVLKRSGWTVVTERIYGAEKSSPVDPSADARMFVYCKRVPNWRDLGNHHDF